MGAARKDDLLADLVVGAVPPRVRTTMTEEQIVAVRDAVSRSVSKRRHKIDVRLTVPLMLSKYYVVLLVGRDTRAESMQVECERRAVVRSASWASTLFIWSLTAFIVGATVAYLMKSRLGINVFPWHLKDVLPFAH